MKRKIPYGVMNWEKAVRECYLVENTPEGRCDFLAVPKPGFAKPACLVEFKYFTNAAAARGNVLGRATPDAETVAQARRYRDALPRRPGWDHPVETYVVEVCGNRGYNWFAV